MLKKILPVGVGIILIVLIAVVASAIKSGNSKAPTFKEANEIYASYDNYNITYDRLYNAMKNSYGLNELINLVDTDIFDSEVKANESNKVFDSKEYNDFIISAIFDKDDLSDLTEKEEKEAVEKWNDVCKSLQINAKISQADASSSMLKDEFNLDTVKASKAWKVVVEEYKLSYTRQEWAKNAYWEKYLKDNDVKEDALSPFKLTIKDSKENSVETYYNNHYLSNVDGLFVPFTSKVSALKAMEQVGINTNSKVLNSSATGWVKDSYNYNTSSTIEDEDIMTYNDVFTAFVKLYNLVNSYKNSGNDIITEADYTEEIWAKQTATKAANAFKAQFAALKLGSSLQMPESFSIKINGASDATLTWSVVNANYVTYSNGVLTGNDDEYSDNELDFSLSYKLTFNDEEVTGTLSNTFSKKEGLTGTVEAFQASDVEACDPFKGYKLTSQALEREDVKLNWNIDDAKEVNETLADYLSVDSESLTISADPENNLYKSYTMEPVQIGDYYFLIIKFADHKVDELFVTDNDEYVKNDDGSYKLCDNGENIIKEINEKMKEELLNDDAVSEMLYRTRQDHDVKIYDRYIEAVYEYQYRTFFEDTLKMTDYDKYQKSKKNVTKYVVTYNKEAGNKKSAVKLETKNLFDALETKYATSVLANLVENYIIINSEFNKVYNPYLPEKNAVLDKEAYHDALNSDAATLKKYFENGNFEQSSLASYGFIPNFPAKYGWSNFIKDYFLCYSDQELLTSASYGGSVYNDVLADFIDSLYSYSKTGEVFNGHTDLEAPTVKSAMDELVEDYYSLKVVNLIVSIDPDYNCNSSSDNAAAISAEHRNDWTEEQTAAVNDLMDLLYQACKQTNKATISEQLAEVANVYNDAGFDGDKEAGKNALLGGKSIYEENYFGYFKRLGLKVKAEAETTYDSSSSLVEEFVKLCQETYDAIPENLVGKDLDAAITANEYVLTDYGYHLVLVTGSESLIDLPTENEVKIYVAAQAIKDVESEIASTESTISQYQQYGYDISSYEAQLETSKKKLAKLQEEQKALLKELNLAEDYELDDATSKKLSTWYAKAEQNIEQGTLVSKAYVAIFQDTMSKFNFKASTMNADRFNEFISILKDECLNAE